MISKISWLLASTQDFFFFFITKRLKLCHKDLFLNLITGIFTTPDKWYLKLRFISELKQDNIFEQKRKHTIGYFHY